MLTIWQTMEKQIRVDENVRVDENDENEKANPDMTVQQRPPVAQVWIFFVFSLFCWRALIYGEQKQHNPLSKAITDGIFYWQRGKASSDGNCWFIKSIAKLQLIVIVDWQRA